MLAWVIIVLLALATLPGVSAQDEALFDEVKIECDGCAPEGIEYFSETDQFLIGSMTQGTIFAVDRDGKGAPFIEDDVLVLTLGIHIDAERNRLLVPNNPEDRSQISLVAYDLTTRERLFIAYLTDDPGDSHLVEDVAIDSEGNAYITDLHVPVIYKVDLDGNASVFLEDERLAYGTLGLNGIEYHPDGYLLANIGGRGILFKIPIDDPTALIQVEMDSVIGGPDGMIWHPNGNLIVAAVFTQEVVSLKSDDDWASATIEAQFDTGRLVTTVALRGEEVYALCPHGLNAYSEYDIVRVQFEAVEE